jgi:hypothetical protein
MKKESGNPDLGILLYIAGGSYFRSAALIDCVRNHMRKYDWQAIHTLDNKVASAWDTVPAVLFHLSGYKTVYWESVCSRPVLYQRHYHKPCKSASILHKTDGNPAKAMYVASSSNKKEAIGRVTSYEQLFGLEGLPREVVK